MREKISFAFLTLLLILASCSTSSVQQNASKTECAQNSDCVPASCCHSTSCVPKSSAPSCSGVFCTEVCTPGTLDCGGSCACQNSKCVPIYGTQY